MIRLNRGNSSYIPGSRQPKRAIPSRSNSDSEIETPLPGPDPNSIPLLNDRENSMGSTPGLLGGVGASVGAATGASSSGGAGGSASTASASAQIDVASAVVKLRRHVFPAFFFIYFLFYMDRSFWPTIVGSMESTRDSDVFFGESLILFYIPQVIFSVPIAYFLSRDSVKNAITFLLILWAAFIFIQAFLTSQISIYFVRLILGVIESPILPLSLYFLSSFYDNIMIILPIALLTVAQSLADVVGPLSSDIILSIAARLFRRVSPGWRFILFFEALSAVALALYLILFMDENIADSRFLTNEEKSVLLRRQTFLARLRGSLYGQSVTTSGKSLWASKRVYLIGLVWSLYTCAISSIHFWIPVYLHSRAFQGPVFFFMFLPSVCSLFFVIFVAWLTTRNKNPSFNLIVLSIASSLSAMSMAILNALTLSVWVNIILLSVTISCMTAVAPPFWFFPCTYFEAEAAPVAFAFIYSAGVLGTVIGPFLSAVLIITMNNESYMLFFIGLTMLLATTICMLFNSVFSQMQWSLDYEVLSNSNTIGPSHTNSFNPNLTSFPQVAFFTNRTHSLINRNDSVGSHTSRISEDDYYTAFDAENTPPGTFDRFSTTGTVDEAINDIAEEYNRINKERVK